MKRLYKALVANFVFLLVCICLVVVSTILFLSDEKFNGEQTHYIAHRGLSSLYFENTVQAFEGAGQSEFFYGIETDIRKTKDGFFVCAHDNNPFSDSSKKVEELSLAQAQLLPLRSVAYRIATFEEYLDICKQYGKIAIIEVKVSLSEAEMQKLLNIVDGKGMLNNCKIISFLKGNIETAKKLSPQISVQVLYNTNLFLDFNFDMSISFNYVTEQHIIAAHQKNLKIGVWTINDKNVAQRFADWGVDYITTDFILQFES